MPVPSHPAESVSRPCRRTTCGRRGAGVALLALVVGSCVEELDLTESELPVLVQVELVPEFAPELQLTARDVGVDVLRLDLRDVETGEAVGEETIVLDPDSVPDRIRIRKDVPRGWEMAIEGTVELIRRVEEEEASFDVVEWAVRVEPVTVTTEQEAWVVPLPFGRGGLAEWGVAAVALSAPDSTVVEGEELQVTPAVQGGPELPRVSWGSEQPDVATVNESGRVLGVLPGEARIIGASGRAWGELTIEVVQGVAEIAVEPEAAVVTAIGGVVEFGARLLDTRGDEVTGRDLEVAWSVEDPDVAVHVGEGVFEGLAPGDTEVVAVAEGQEGRAILTVAPEPASVEIVPDEVLLVGIGADLQLEAEVRDAGGTLIAGAEVEWSSTDEGIFTVNPSGVVTAVEEGAAEVRARAGEAEATVPVTVLAEPIFEGDLVILDDEDLADFQQRGWEEVTGNLRIGGEGSTLTDLAGMETLRRVAGVLEIRDNPSLLDISALAGIEDVGLALLFERNDALSEWAGLPALATVGEGIRIAENPLLASVPGFPVLVSLGQSLQVIDNPELQGIGDFPLLETVGEGVSIVSNGLLEGAGEFSALRSVRGGIVIEANGVLSALGGFPTLETVADGVRIISNAALGEVPGFPELTWVGGDLEIRSNAELEGVGGFPLLETVEGAVVVSSNPVLETVGEFSALLGIGGGLSLDSNDALSALGGFPVLESVGGTLLVQSSGEITSLDALSALRSVGEHLWILNNPLLENLDGLLGLDSTIQDLLIDNNPALNSIQGLENVGSATEASPAVLGNFTVTDNPLLPESTAWDLVEALGVAGTVTISGNLDDDPDPAVIEWVGEGGAWSDPSNWSLERVPIPGDTVELVADGTYTVTIDLEEVAVGALRVGPQSGLVTLALQNAQLTLTEWLELRPTAVLSVADEAIIVTPDLGNSGTISAEGTLSVMTPSGPVDAVNEEGGRIEVGPEGVVQFLLGGGTLANRGVIEGTGAGAALVLQNGTVTLEEGGELLGTGLLAAVGATLNLGTPLPAEDWELFLTQSEVNGPEPILVPEGAEWTWTDATVNTFVENRGGLVFLGVNALNAGLVHAPGAMVEVVGLSDRDEASLTVTESDGFFIEGGVRLYDPFPGEDRVLRLSVPQGSLVVDEEGVIEVLATTGTTVGEVRGDLTNRGRIVVEAPVVMGSDEGWQQNAGLIEILADGVLTFAGERFDNTTQGDLIGEIRGEGVLEVNGVEFTNSALIAPGLSPGILTVEGDLVLDEGSTLEIGLAGTEAGAEHDRLVVTGQLTLGGSLVVQLEDGFTPSFGDQFMVLTWGSRAGDFAGIQLPTLFDGLEWDVEYGEDGLTLSVTAPTEPARLAGGNAHTCAIDDGGTIHCWGLNNVGQLGDGTIAPRSEAAPVLGGLTYAEVTASISGACGLTTDGAAYCWGGNLFGVLGTGGDEGEVQPTRVATNAEYTQLSGYVHHVCGLVQGGGAECWGRNDFGQLGDGGTVNSNAPVAVVGEPTFREISTGTNHTCALDDDGFAYCWGRNEAGELGDGTNQQRTTPTPVAGGIRFRTISAGHGYTCAVDMGARVHCWGSGLTEPTLQPGDVRFRTFSSGTNFRCGTDVDGNAHCWGSNTQGQLGDGTTTARSEPVPVAGGLIFEEVRASGPNVAHACGRTGGGEVHCWGSDSSGQLGTGRLLWTADPIAVPEVPDFVEVTLGGQHACGLTDTGAAWCWGTNSQGQLGDGSTATPLLPVQVAGGITFDALEAGLNHTCGLSDGEMYCWGSNFVGQLGDGTTTQRLVPTPVAGDLRFEAMGIGWNHSCGLADFTAYCWGANQAGEVGDGTQTQRDSPTPVDTELIFFDITAGSSFTCALAEDDGTGYCWGFGTSGRLGTGSGANQLRPAQLSTDPAFERVIAGSQHACALTIFNLTPYCWGLNSSGQIGDGTTTTRFEPVPIGDGLSFTDMALSGVTTCGVDGQGTVHCWGDNTTGTVGDGTTTRRLTPTPVSGGIVAAGIGRVTGGSATDTSFLVVGPDRTTWGWGSNTHRRVFPGDPIQSEVPVRALFP